MISEKMTALAKGNSAIRAMFEEGNRLAALYGRENVFDFSLGNPNFPAPKEVKEAIYDILENEDSTFVHGYMSNAGYPDVREAIAGSLNRRFGSNYNAGNIIMTVGAASGLNIILKTLLNPGDQVMAIAPYFVEYGNYVRNFDGELVVVPPTTADFQPDAQEVAKRITEKTRALILNTPNNPTGVIYTPETLSALAKVLEEKQKEFGTSIYIISDEPYRELAYNGADVPWIPNFYRNTIVGYSWSKSLSLPGERIGYVVIPSEADDGQLIFDAACIANRVIGSVNAPSLFQRVVMKCVDLKTDLTGYDANRQMLYTGLTDLGFEAVYPDGAFYMWVKVPDGDDAKFVENAKKYNLLVVPGRSFAGPGYVRLAYCVSADTIKNSLPGFAKLAADYGLNK
ncbi:MAG: pyridoxal phosphate-dependent aminotransferase [Oscillospiraceae bacterium]|nr:pyridoxal phosphate-dependent aminotransferase [Oscillospiraceae bacterium]